MPIITPKPALLFDIDGVVVRNQNLLGKVSNRCMNFIKLIHTKDLYPFEAQSYNEKLYKTYGHSLKGWFVDNNIPIMADPSQSIESLYKTQLVNMFNRYVYDDAIIMELETYLYSKEFKEANYDFVVCQNTCAAKDIPLYLYSNAPFVWCSFVANVLNISEAHIYSSDHALLYPQMLYKPDIQSYNNVSYDILEQNKDVSHLVFIDDTLRNLKPIAENSTWTPLLYKPNSTCSVNTSTSCGVLKNIKSITSISEITTKLDKY